MKEQELNQLIDEIKKQCKALRKIMVKMQKEAAK